MFDAQKVEPITNLIGLNREPTNDEMQEAARVGLEMLCALVNAVVRIADNLEATTDFNYDQPARRNHIRNV